MTTPLAPFTLTLVCRQPLMREYSEPCQHTHSDDCCGAPRVDGKLPEGHQHSTHDCCEHDCDGSGDCGSGISYAPAYKGTHKQCGESATFTTETLTAATDEAVAAGWRIDLAWLGFYTRSDVCPECNESEYGGRPNLALIEDDPDVLDTYAAA